jgi:hypothetical protein
MKMKPGRKTNTTTHFFGQFVAVDFAFRVSRFKDYGESDTS